MTAKQSTLTILIAFTAGLCGGFFSNQILIEKSALAEKKEVHEKVLRAEVFELTSEEGRTHARLYLSNKGPVFRMQDWGGATAELWAGHFGGASAAGLSLTSPKNETIRLAATDFDTTIFSSKANE